MKTADLRFLLGILFVFASCSTNEGEPTCKERTDVLIYKGQLLDAIKNQDYELLDNSLKCWNPKDSDLTFNGQGLLTLVSTKLDLGSMAIVIANKQHVFDEGELAKAMSGLLSQQFQLMDKKDSIKRKILIAEGIRVLVNAGIDSSFTPASWMVNPFKVALTSLNDPDLVSFLLKRGIGVNQNYREVGNALFWTRDSSLIMDLIRNGVDTSFTDIRGKRFYEFHRSNHHDELEPLFNRLGY